MTWSGRYGSTVTVLLLAWSTLHAQPTPLKEVLALEATVQSVIKQAEPSIACVLVSRSEEYSKRGFGGSPAQPGKLGGFTFEKTTLPTPPGFPPREDPRVEQLRRLDLSEVNNLPEAFGSGVVIDENDRLVLTCFHVIRDATKIYVRLPGQQGSYADVYAADPRSDLAILQLLEPRLKLKALKLGETTPPEKGQFVLALANPFAAGFRDGSPVASWGMLGGLRRRVLAAPTSEMERTRLPLSHLNTLLQIDARLTLGSSGGALLNLKGEWIGITNSLAALTGLETPGGFALPLSPNIRKIIDTLRRGEEVEYGFLGVTMSADTKPGAGYRIGEPLRNSPAAKAGLHQGDTILSINGQKIQEGDDLFLEIGTALAGSTVRLEIVNRDGVTSSRQVTLVKASVIGGQAIASKRADPTLYGGLRVDYSSVLLRPGRGLFLDYIPNGVVIRDVAPNSPADKLRLQPDKLITHVNGTPVLTPYEFYREVQRTKEAVELTLSSLDRDARTERIKLERR